MSVHEDRCKRAQRVMGDKEIDWLAVSSGPDLRYITGYKSRPSERLTLFLLPQGGRPAMVMPEFEAIRLEQEGYHLFYDIKTWAETDDPITLVADTLGPSPGTVAVAEQVWSVFLLRIQKTVQGAAQYVSGGEVLAPLRMRKDEAEIRNLRQVGHLLDQVFDKVCKLQFAGRSEMDVGGDIFEIVRDIGLNPTRAGGVASGPNSGSAHHESGERVIQPGDSIWLELGQGGSIGGYAADKTRTVHVGQPSDEYVRAYEVVKEAQATAASAVRPGVECQEIDRIARRIITDAGYGEYFTHRVGHGLGLESHEPPYMVEGNTEQLEPGMVFSVEPGVYIPGRFGIRIEDIVAVTEDGVENFYASTHDLVVVE